MINANSTGLALGVILALAVAHDGASAALAKPKPATVLTISPEEGMISRSRYVPGTEKLGPNEMRVVALGTGMPSARPKQASACWLVELGNGDKFIFDIGADCYSHIAAQKIQLDYLDKVFVSHLHLDHIGDMGSFWLGGATMNRTTPLRVWGPSGTEPKYGMKNYMTKLEEMYAWDVDTRGGVIDKRGLTLEVHEFDYRGLNTVVYEANGVVIRAFPAAHGEGSVCYVLEWKGLKLAYSGDNVPHQFWVDYTKDADISIHESFLPSVLLVTKQHFTPAEALTVGTLGHTPPEQFGAVMTMTKPRMAVAYHVYNDRDTAPVIRQRIRKFYDGPLAIAQDYMVFNITKADIRVRMSNIDTEVWPLPATREKMPPDVAKMLPLLAGPTRDVVLSMPEVVGPIYDEINKLYATKIVPLTDTPLVKGYIAAARAKRASAASGATGDAPPPTR